MSRGKPLGDFTDATVDLIFARDGGRCAKCGQAHDRDNGRGLIWSVHHRAPRGAGGARHAAWVGEPSNGVILCGHGTIGCHQEVERFRGDSFTQGFLVSRIGKSRPHEIPVRHSVHGWCLLDQEGGVAACSIPEMCS